MKIDKLKINAYGRLKNKEIEFGQNLNLIYGKNESGKSTLLKFILNCLYGTSKNKKGKDISDFDRYKPWKSDEFSGKLKYKLDNGKVFEVYREFGKKNPKIYDENMEDVSNEYSIDKTRGSDFFYEQTKVDENLFSLTTAIEQKEVKLDVTSQNTLIQKIANILGTGEDNVSYKKAIDKISKRQLNEIGTEKSKERPINVLMQEIKDRIGKIQEIDNYSLNKSLLEQKEVNTKNKIVEAEKELSLIKAVKDLYLSEMDIKNEIKIKEELNYKNKNQLIDLEEKIRKIQSEIDKKEELMKDKIKTFNKFNLILVLFFIINLIVYLKNIFVGFSITTIVLIAAIAININIFKLKKNIKNNVDNELSETKQKRNVIIENIEKLDLEIVEIKENYTKNSYLEKEKINKKYENLLNLSKINEILQSLSLDFKEENIQEQINSFKIELNTIQLEKKNIEEKIEHKLVLEEEIYAKQNQFEELAKISKSMNVAKEVLELSYEKMKNNVAPKFTEKLSKNISEITDNKYNHIMINTENGLIIENDLGDYISVDRLSVGTIDQIYFALRLAVMDELTEEKLPIILDEVFAYYDDERIKNILKFLEKQKERQIIIFSCTKREKEILEKLNIEVNYIEI